MDTRTSPGNRARNRRWLLVAGLIVVLVVALGSHAGTGEAAPLADVPVGGTIQMDNACYVRLPSLPTARYGGFGAYNPDTGVLAFAGGADQVSPYNIISDYDLYAIKLDGSMTAWAPVPYSSNAGYLRQPDRGCREMATVMLGPTTWASVGGKDGCDGSTSLYGDIKALSVGSSADATQVRWLPNTGADLAALPPILAANRFSLSRPFAAYDPQRERIVFGQGAFATLRDATTRSEVYYATAQGMKWKVRQLFPQGPAPASRYGSCGAYVYDKDQALDGVFVLGGVQGGPLGTTVAAYPEAWWLDFKDNPQGRWVNLTPRFGNWAEFGYRLDGGCAYDPDTKQFYSWMGGTFPGIPDGAVHSAGFWRTSLASLGDAAATLSWERLAKDNQTDVKGERIFPSVYDLKTKRFFALGGRAGLVETVDVWAIYPDVTGDACTNLDAYAPFRNPVTPTPAPSPVPTPLPADPQVCQTAKDQVPPAVLASALATPAQVPGYGELCNPSAPANPWNRPRDRLSLEIAGRPYHPLFNALVWKCGCP